MCLKKGITLIELLVSVVLLSIVILTLAGVDFWARSNLVSSDRRTKLQNEAAHVIDHITKMVTGTDATGGAIGNTVITGQDPVSIANINGFPGIRIYLDWDCNAIRSAGDRWIAYQYRNATAAAGQRYQMWYYNNCPDANCTGQTGELIASHVSDFLIALNDNFLELVVGVCWDPTTASGACGSSNNPNVVMQAKIRLPAVSIR